MPRILWRRRYTLRRRTVADSSGPAGRRRWARLRRGGVLARRVLRVRHRRTGEARLVEPYPAPHAPARPGAEFREPPNRPAPRTAVERAAPAPPRAAQAAPVRMLPGEPSLTRRAQFLLVTGCTLASLSLGLLAILLAMRGDVQLAAACLIACVGFDGLDGALARRLGVSSPFGAQLDSLADMCAFGFAAPVVVYASVASERSGDAAGSVPAAAAAVTCALAAGCAAIRLARYNISPRDSRFFNGVPTTMAAAVLAMAVLIDLPLPPAVLLLGVALLAISMVSSFPYATLTRLLRLPPWLWLAPLAGALIDPRLTFVAAVGAYLASGPLVWFHHRRAV